MALSGVPSYSLAAGRDRCRRSSSDGDLFVDAMNQDFAFLIHGDFTGSQARPFLRGVPRGITGVAGAVNGSLMIDTMNDMLVFAHIGLFFKLNTV